VHLVGFIIKKFTMHGHMNVKFVLIVPFFEVSETDPNTLSLQSDMFYPFLVLVVNKP
jgi:hypothetical protein